MSISRVYADVNNSKPQTYWDYENVSISWGSQNKYEITKKVGRGKYSEVFEGIQLNNKLKIIIKVLKPIKRKKIKREIKILQNLSNYKTIIKLIDVVRDFESKIPSLIFEHVDNIEFRILYPKLTKFEIKYYMYLLLDALNYSHSMGIMHRDIKPHNIMIDHNRKKLRLIDWGLAEFYHPNIEYNVRVASRFFKAPELLVNYKYYNYSIDIWSFGVTLASIVFQKEPFFNGKSNLDQLIQIIRVLGTDDFYSYLNKYNIELSKEFEDLGYFIKKPWIKFINSNNNHLIDDELIDFIDKILRYDHMDRLTAKECMMHDYFKVIRESDITVN
ncbi:hypothetical protein CANARDRAFT_177179 [[Candida] arabinofermentans NRRL YB-2248]|uniref:Casein kinase II subunit alpha n=1 Tax=[Candida] arabinofermentans NRRL YB-2248 TaxID=983967 RepID=A0A1E4SWX5_9ASCO|nr:hypothetical protein CANARDRAFT_177179 [[Candida] arabinofermentans NRRL YB-2248]